VEPIGLQDVAHTVREAVRGFKRGELLNARQIGSRYRERKLSSDRKSPKRQFAMSKVGICLISNLVAHIKRQTLSVPAVIVKSFFLFFFFLFSYACRILI
jgi:hypothetical protein